MRLLLIDDDHELCGLLSDAFRRESIDCAVCHEGTDGVQQALSGQFDLVVLDVMLPGIDGFEVLRQVRQSSDVPVLMLTARGDDVDRVVGLEMGADDYLPKPFYARELLARIGAILRRTQVAAQRCDDAIEIDTISLDPATRLVSHEGETVPMTSREFEVLQLLMRSAGRVVTRDQFAWLLYQRTASPTERALDMHVSNLRRKLGSERIRTVRSVGYLFPRTARETRLQ